MPPPPPFNFINFHTQKMACKLRRRITLRRKLQILRTLTKSKSVKKSSIITDASFYIHNLKLQVEELKKECQHLISHIQEVKVENFGTGYLLVRVRCKKGEGMVESILEVFEEMNVDVVEANICCKDMFAMEAVVEPAAVDAAALNRALLKIVQTQTTQQ